VVLPATGSINVGLLRYPAASGATSEEVDWHFMELAPEVLLVPVRVTVFTNGSPNLWTEDVVRQLLDPAQVATQSATVGGSPVVANAVSRETPSAVSPDSIWTQCNIQFRLVDFVPVTNAVLASQLSNSCSCEMNINGIASPVANRPIREHLVAAPDNVVNIFMGGTIAGTACVGDVNGVTCGGSNAGSFGCPVTGTGQIDMRLLGGENFILLNQSFPFGGTLPREVTFAHELGHFLGLTHSPNGSGLDQCLQPGVAEGDTTDVSNLLMLPGGSSSPVLTPLQCVRSRCIAARWLELFSPSAASTQRRVNECTGL
jgi:hypothetical protein